MGEPVVAATTPADGELGADIRDPRAEPALPEAAPAGGLVAEADAVALVLRYQQGESAALAALYALLRPPIFSCLRPYRSWSLPPCVSMQDLTQQSWVILADLAARWQPAGSFLAYFFQSFPHQLNRFVLRAHASGRSRSVRVLTVPHDDLVLKLERWADGDPAPGERLPLDSLPVMDDLLQLPPLHRAAFLLRALDGYDFEAIGRLLQVSRATAHRLYHQARARLRARQGAPDPAPPRSQERLVQALHAAAGPYRELPGRRRMAELTGLNRREYTSLLAQLAAAGAIAGRGPARAGHLVDTTPAATLRRLRAAGYCQWPKAIAQPVPASER